VTQAHIHVGDANTAGPIVVELFNAGGTPVSFTTRGELVDDTFTEADIQAAGGIETLDDLLDAMEAGNTYVNVHTSANPAGEIRGQLVPHVD
jgi:phosphoribosylformimino-5-aminoimidazole carboxamide ribonucleotide (ProFAR) isomerase